MTREEYEFEQCVADATKRFHDRTGKYPTKEFVLKTIRDQRNTGRFSPGHFTGTNGIQKQTYIWFAYSETIRRIRENPDPDPIRIIYKFYYYMDDTIGNNDNPCIWPFLGTMQDAVHKILDLLR